MEQARQPSTGPKLIDLLVEVFELRGEDIVRRTTGATVRPPRGRAKVITVRGSYGLQYHRVKFALSHGWLPAEVDHHDRNRDNMLLSNLRPATHQTNMQNRQHTHRKHKLPRGVYPAGRRFRAMVQVAGVLRHLGCFETPGQASAVVEPLLQNLHGEFYCATPISR